VKRLLAESAVRGDREIRKEKWKKGRKESRKVKRGKRFAKYDFKHKYNTGS